MKNINNFTQWKNGSVDVAFTHAITHQKHLAQSGRSTRSAVDIFNALCVFMKEPIREQEIKLECMNLWEWLTSHVICGNGVCNLGRGYAICGNGLCNLWERVMQSVGMGYSICGNGLCYLWERVMLSVGKGYVICGNGLCNLWELVM